ncbi:MAG: alpha/beta fold hydrolase [Dokdonella sp.]
MIQKTDFFFEGGPSGVLLIHGLTGTPNEMRVLGKGLNNAGFTVYGMQLAGHCGSVDDLLESNAEDWFASVQVAAQWLRERVEDLFVCGLSMGALLALRLAAEQPDRIHGVGVFGATFRYDGWSIPPIARLSFLLPLISRLGIGRRRSFVERPPYGLRDERIRAHVADAMFGADSSVAGLPGNPWPSLAELFTLSRKVRKLLPEVTSPCLVAHAVDDDIASIANAHLVASRISAPFEMLLLKDSYHMITIDRERRTLIAGTSNFFQRIAASRCALRRAA